jgi:CHASE2 domain-containing sensor protein
VLIPSSYSALAALQAGAVGDATTMGLAIERSGRVVLPEWRVEGQRLRPLAQWQLKALEDPDPNGADFGFVNLTEDGDEFMRRQQLAAHAGQDTIQFAFALVARSMRKPISYDARRKQLMVGATAIPLDSEDMLRINFVGPPGTFPCATLYQLLRAARQRQPMSGLRGAIAIIGSIGRGGQDMHNIPFNNRYADYFHRRGGGLMSGPELHANIVATLQDSAFIQTPCGFRHCPGCSFSERSSAWRSSAWGFSRDFCWPWAITLVGKRSRSANL